MFCCSVVMLVESEGAILHFAFNGDQGHPYGVAFLLTTFVDHYFSPFFFRVRKESSDEQFKFSSVILHFAFCIQ